MADQDSNNQVITIDSEISKILGLEDNFDLDPDEYLQLVREKLVQYDFLSASKKITPEQEEEQRLLATQVRAIREHKRSGDVKFTTGDAKKKIKADSFFNRKPEETKEPEKRIVDPSRLLSGSTRTGDIIKYKSQKVEELKDEKPEEDDGESKKLIAISNILDSILSTFKNQFKFDQKKTEDQRKDKETKRREKRESGLEKGFAMVTGAVKKMLAPLQNIFDQIWKYFFFTFLGKVFNDFMDWLGDPKNKKKVEVLGRFLKDWWPLLLGAYIAFATPFGFLVRGAIKMVLGLTGKILGLLPKLLRLSKGLITSAPAKAAGRLLLGAVTNPLVVAGAVTGLAAGTAEVRRQGEEKKLIEQEAKKEGKTSEQKKEEIQKGKGWFDTFGDAVGGAFSLGSSGMYGLSKGGVIRGYSGGAQVIDGGYSGVDNNTGVSITGAGRDTQLIAARPGEVVLTPEDANKIQNTTGFDVYNFVKDRKPSYTNFDKIKTTDGVSLASSGGILGFRDGGVVTAARNIDTRRLIRSKTSGLLDPKQYNRTLGFTELWHGTNNIFKDNMTQSGIDPRISGDGALGRGFYTTPDIEIAKLYARQASEKSGGAPGLIKLMAPNKTLRKYTQQINKPPNPKYSNKNPKALLQYHDDFAPPLYGNAKTSSMYVFGGQTNRDIKKYGIGAQIGDISKGGLSEFDQIRAVNLANRYARLSQNLSQSRVKSKNAPQRWLKNFSQNKPKPKSKPLNALIKKVNILSTNTMREGANKVNSVKQILSNMKEKAFDSVQKVGKLTTPSRPKISQKVVKVPSRTSVPSRTVSAGLQNMQPSSFNRYRPGATIRATGPNMERFGELQRFISAEGALSRTTKMSGVSKVLNNPGVKVLSKSARVFGKAARVLDVPVLGDMVLPEGTSEFDQRSSAYNDPRLTPFQRRSVMNSVGIRGGGIMGGYKLKEQSFKDAPNTQLMSDGSGDHFVGYKAMRGGRTVYLRGPQPGTGSSNFFERLGRSYNPDAYKNIDAINKRNQYNRAGANSLQSLRQRGASSNTISRRSQQQASVTRSLPRPTSKPKTNTKRWAADPRGWFGMQGGGSISAITSKTGVSTKDVNINSGADTRYLPQYNTAVQPGEEIFKYVIPKDAAQKGVGGKLLQLTNQIIADSDSNSTAAKIGFRNRSINIKPPANKINNNIVLPPVKRSSSTGAKGSSASNSQDLYSFSPILETSIDVRKMHVDMYGILD